MQGEGHAQAYRYGSDLAVEVTAPDEAGCLAGAVRALAGEVARPDDLATRHHERIEIFGDQALDRLVGLLNHMIARLDTDGQLTVDLVDPAVERDRLRGRLVLVDLGASRSLGPAPKAATWHRLEIAPRQRGWYATAVIDL